MSRYYRDLPAPRVAREAKGKLLSTGVNLGVPNRLLARFGFCAGCKNELEHCSCDDDRDELDFEANG